MRRLGIIGGLGPETSCSFCLSINRSFRMMTGCQPDIVLENLPVPLEEEQRIIRGELSEKMKQLLIAAARNLEKSGADFIVIPCNTVHVFLESIRDSITIPVLSIIEVCSDECERIGIARAGLLASTTTVNTRLHTDELAARGIRTILPAEDDQEKVSELILKIIHNRTTTDDRKQVQRILSQLKDKGAEAVILGCTDLPLFITQQDTALPIVDTLALLEQAVTKHLKGDTALLEIEIEVPSGHKTGRD